MENKSAIKELEDLLGKDYVDGIRARIQQEAIDKMMQKVMSDTEYDGSTVDYSCVPDDVQHWKLSEERSWRPYCCTTKRKCDSGLRRMDRHYYGFKCSVCGNTCNWECESIEDPEESYTPSKLDVIAGICPVYPITHLGMLYKTPESLNVDYNGISLDKTINTYIGLEYLIDYNIKK